jgi:hypothetical protein
MIDDTLKIIPSKTLFEREDFLECRNLFYSRRWVNVLTTAYNFDIQAVVNPRDRQHLLFSVHNDFSGKRLLSLPFSDYVLPDVELNSIPRFMEAIAKIYNDYSIIYRADATLSPAFEGNNWKVIREAMYHRVIIQDEETMWKNLSPSFRRGVKKANKNGVQVSLRYDSEAIDRFYELHSQLRKEKFHSLSQPPAFFHTIHQEFIAQKLGFVMEAIHSDQLLASIIILVHNHILYYKFGTSAVDLLDSRPNNILFWYLLLYALENGYEQVDLGLSGKAPSYEGLVRFKEGLGGVPKPITYFRKDPPHFDYQKESEVKKLLSDLTNLFVDESTDIKTAQKAGQILYRYFS